MIELLDHAGTGNSEGGDRRPFETLVGRPLDQPCCWPQRNRHRCSPRTRDLAAVCSPADVLVAAVGVPELGAELMSNQCDRDRRRHQPHRRRPQGDVTSEAAVEVAGAITPVPGGSEPMTIAMLMANTLAAARARAI